MSKTAWTDPFHGVSHYGAFSLKARWATVEEHGTFAKLMCWFPGCGFSPTESQHDSAQEAKRKGAAWVEEAR